ncbi:MAG: hypothetical protein LGB78_06500 [Sulfurovum sp.]|nr:hypothetical protein [Sulfurovum sp.]
MIVFVVVVDVVVVVVVVVVVITIQLFNSLRKQGNKRLSEYCSVRGK